MSPFYYIVDKLLINIYDYIESDFTGTIETYIKLHNGFLEDFQDFIIQVDNGKITNPEIIKQCNQYIFNFAEGRSYVFEGMYKTNNTYYIQWCS